MIELYDIPYKSVEKVLTAAMKRLGVSESDIAAEIASLPDEEIRTLNREERGVDSVTDVLSFPAQEKITFPFDPDDYSDIDPETGAVLLGEVYIARDRAAEQAREYGHSVAREYAFLALHGFLHLMGYDHIRDEDRAEMEAVQSEILTSAGVERDYTEAPEIPVFTDDEIEESDENEESDDKTSDTENAPCRAGFAAILGRPNAGKSTLTNALIGEKVAIVSWKPQTTRNKISGILNRKNLQIVFVDTPGIHTPRNKLGNFMMRSVKSAEDGVDAVVYVIDCEKGLDAGDVERIREISAHIPTVAAVNKVDSVTRAKVAEILTALNEVKTVKSVVPISALKNKNIDVLISEVEKLMPFGTKFYPDDMYTDRNMRFMASEIIREKALRLLDKEIPYGIAVAINKYEYRPSGTLEIDADVICQKAAHKPIILGKNGAMIKKISEYARQDLEAMTGDKILLTLWVRVKKDWRDDDIILSNLGYDKNKDI